MEASTPRSGAVDVSEAIVRRGTNQSGMRDRNERLVLSLVRQHGSLAKSDIARMTGLSAQTVSVIMRELESEGLLLRREKVRGKVGQPLIPMALNPDGAYFIGLKIGRRSAELVLIDFLGNLRLSLQDSYGYPAPNETIKFVTEGIRTIRNHLKPAEAKRIAGLGVAMPFELWNWADTVGAPHDVMDGWRQRDLRAEIQAEFTFPVYLQNDATAACGAELVFGKVGGISDFLYFYIGAFAGGGIVLNGSVYTGPGGNAGALGSMPVPGPDGMPRQLIDIASIAILEKALNAKGIEASHLWTAPEDWGHLGAELDIWIENAANALAYAIASASSVIDFEAVILDGWMPYSIRARLVVAIDRALSGIDAEGLVLPTIREGTVGIHARALGAASLPLSERFLIGPAHG
ncbi:ROK family transcriptional regulator [Corticibacterium sp. UT-5YL-CI-8]|nr:ROK family transcriptional regulator [Tianweitania sp. UT-5YL-CI-8]